MSASLRGTRSLRENLLTPDPLQVGLHDLSASRSSSKVPSQ